MSDSVITVKGIHKAFKLPHEKQGSLKNMFVNVLRRNRGFERQQVLNDVNLEVKKGDFFGIVGRNGSGKSTLLKLLAGIYSPDKGHIQINGQLTPFIELGVGFNPELTGRENVYLNGALLGFGRKEMNEMYDDIVNFAGLERFMDQKLKNYSSGMQVRLAFSIAIQVESDILLIDEVLAVGDAAFQQKCFEVFAELKKKGVTIILVTHDMTSVLRFCNKAILINQGEIVKRGKPNDVADAYLELNYESTKANDTNRGGKLQQDDTKAKILKTAIRNADGKIEHSFNSKDSMKVCLDFTNPTGEPIHFGFQIFNDSGTYCFGTNTSSSGVGATNKTAGRATITLEPNLVAGNYYVTVATMNNNTSTVLNYRPKAAQFRIIKDNQTEGIVNIDNTWKYENV